MTLSIYEQRDDFSDCWKRNVDGSEDSAIPAIPKWSSAESLISHCSSSSSYLQPHKLASQSSSTFFLTHNCQPIALRSLNDTAQVRDDSKLTEENNFKARCNSSFACLCCTTWQEPDSSQIKRMDKCPTPSRNRDKQTWETHPDGDIRLCCTTIPVRFVVSPEDGSKSLQILLITSRRKGDWIIPRGGWDNDETKCECAVRETREEAGVEGTIIASFGHYTKRSSKGWNTKVYIFIMNVNIIKEHWAEESRNRKWFDLGFVINNYEAIFKRPELVDIWKKLISFSKSESSRKTAKSSLHDMLWQIQQRFDIRKIPIPMLPWKTANPVFWHNHAKIAIWLDEHFPIATTVRGQPGSSRKSCVQYKRPWSYFVVHRDGRTTQCLGRMRPVELQKCALLDLLKSKVLSSDRRNFKEKAFKFLWVLTVSGEFLVTEEYARFREDRYINHGDLVPARLSDYEYCHNSPRQDSNIVENVYMQGKYRGIARMGGELIYTVRCGTWIMNNISGFSLARVSPRCISLPSKQTWQGSDAYLDSLQYDSLAKLRIYLGRFIVGMDKVILLSADIGDLDLKQGLKLRIEVENDENEELRSYKIRMEDLLDMYFKFYFYA